GSTPGRDRGERRRVEPGAGRPRRVRHPWRHRGLAYDLDFDFDHGDRRGSAVTARPAVDGSIVELCAVLGDETRWQILAVLGSRAASASELARELPVSRQAIAKHLELLAQVGLAERERAGREVRYRALGARLTELADHLETIGRGWEARLSRLKDVAEQLPRQ